MYLSVDGVVPIGYLQRFSPRQVMVAMNRDELGLRPAQAALPEVRQVQPEGEDWLGSLPLGQAQSVNQLVLGGSVPMVYDRSRRVDPGEPQVIGQRSIAARSDGTRAPNSS
jgi:hypothetical protein